MANLVLHTSAGIWRPGVHVRMRVRVRVRVRVRAMHAP